MMNVIRPEKIDGIDEDENLAAVTEVEAGIRDFVRNDVAYLRRPAPGLLGATEPALAPLPVVLDPMALVSIFCTCPITGSMNCC